MENRRLWFGPVNKGIQLRRGAWSVNRWHSAPVIRAADEPTLVAVTSANLDRLDAALGPHATEVDREPAAFDGRSPAQRVADLNRYWRQRSRASSTGRARILAEPAWLRRSRHEGAGWTRLEAALNMILADTTIWMICPYVALVADAWRTHPTHIQGQHTSACPEFVEPQEFAQASAQGFIGDALSLWTPAGAELAGYVAHHGSGQAAIRVWPQRGNPVCEVHDLTGPFLGYRPPSLIPQPGDELRLPLQLCTSMDIRRVDGPARPGYREHGHHGLR